MHFYTWKKGLKTGMYYLRTQAASRAIQFTINDDNTLLDDVKTNSLQHFAHKSKKFIGAYPSHARFQRESESISNENKDDVYGIHDSTPVVCNITEGGTCESCSG